ncbi:NUDIX hydrolase [Candidatus Phyllobacterium onerii]|uniref:NUDIX hydrolase n=1 Tax=Candidatus Phyllobacterium onerii TaxID=3020828 RepID=UPI00232E8AD2|nr:NUDIX hydrolase [Phyllobacterium sp. IY22]
MAKSEKKTGRAAPQVAALPYRLDSRGRVTILLITSRRTKRYIIPKGWKMKHKKDASAAAQEAKEEAGVIGAVSKQPIGSYSYQKEFATGKTKVKVAVYALQVTEQLWQWPEQKERTRIWVEPERAVNMISDVSLIPLLRTANNYARFAAE